MPSALVLAVGAITAACAFEAVLLHSTAARGVAPYYPRAYDQVQYLTESYRAYDTMRSHGVVAGALGTFGEPRVQGWLLQLEAAFLFLITGPGRMPALDLNILYLVAYIGIGGGLVYRRLGAGPALVFTGLVIAASSVTRLVGGVFDFRLDFAALCVWGIVVGLLAFGGGLRHVPTQLALIVAGAVFTAVRTLGFAYLAGTVVCLVLTLGVAIQARGRNSARLRLLGALAIWTVLEGAFVVQNWTLVRNYYIGEHLLNDEGTLRAASVGASDLLSGLTFYPRSLFVDQFGTASQAMFVATLLLAGALAVLRRPATADPPRDKDIIGLNLRWTALVLAASTIVPCAALTLDHDRSDVVGNILLPPVIYIGVVVLGVATHKAHLNGRTAHSAVALFGACCVLLACLTQGWGIFRRSPEFSTDSDAARASQFILRIADRAAQLTAGPVKWSVDSHLDFGAVQVVSLYYYEQRGVWPNFTEGLGEGSIQPSLSTAEVETIANASSTLILTDADAATLAYPYDRSVAAAKPLLRAIADRDFDLIAQDKVYNLQVWGFIRRGLATPT